MSGSIPLSSTPRTVNLQIYLEQKRNAALLNEVLNAKLSSFPKSAVERYEAGLALVGTNDDGALKEFRAAIGIYPQFSFAFLEIGKIYIRQNKLDEAIEAFRSTLSIDPTDFDAHLNYGIALLNKRSLDDARSEFDRAIALNQTAVTPHFYMGIVFVQQRDLDSAQRKMEFAKQLAGSNEFPLIHKYLGGIYWQKGATMTVERDRRGLFKQAVEELEKYVKLLPTANDAKKIRATIADLRTKMG
jgi:tetratricopeptide (TPR) repeat protein